MTDVLRDLEAVYEPVRGADRRVITRVTAGTAILRELETDRG